MEKKYLLFWAVLSLSLLMTSCRARFYTANSHPVPLFREKGEIYIDGSTNVFNKMDLTAATAVTDNIGAYIGYAGAAQSFGSDSGSGSKYAYRGNMLNLGLGYFVNKKQSETFRFDIYGDFGYGTFRNQVTGADYEKFNGNYMRLGIMPTLGYRSLNDVVSISYSIRASNLRFFNEKISDTSYWQSDIKRYRFAPNYLMLEHAITLKLGSGKFKFQLQGAYYQGLNADRTDNYGSAVPYMNFALMLGFVVNLNYLNHN